MSSYTVKELRIMAKSQSIKYLCLKSKEELCRLLNIPYEGIKDRHKYLLTVQKKPIAITLTNYESNEEHNFNSIFKCSKYFNVNSGMFFLKRKCSKPYSDWIMIRGIKFMISYP